MRPSQILHRNPLSKSPGPPRHLPPEQVSSLSSSLNNSESVSIVSNQSLPGSEPNLDPSLSSSTAQNSRTRSRIPNTGSILPPRDHVADASEQLLKQEIRPGKDNHQHTPRFVRWGIQWQKPALLTALFCAAVAFAVGHHFYYKSLNQTPAGTKSQQRWATTIGTAFSFLVVAFLRSTTTNAYHQYIWILFKRKPLELGTLDRLFALISNPGAFFSVTLVREAKIAIIIALVCWCLPIAGVTPPATLAVVSGQHNKSMLTLRPALDWSLSSFWYHDLDKINIPTGDNIDISPSPEVMNVARASASNMRVLPPSVPAANSSFNMQFYGPSLQCSFANETQQPYFNYYLRHLAQKDVTASKNTLEESYRISNFSAFSQPLLLMSSIFDPFGYYESTSNGGIPNSQSNTWNVSLGGDFINSNSFSISEEEFNKAGFFQNGANLSWVLSNGGVAVDSQTMTTIFAPQLWIQTASESLTCIMVNASYDVQFEFVGGSQTKAEYTLKDQQVHWMPLAAPSYRDALYNQIWSYKMVFDSLSALLSGNITMSIYDGYTGMIPGSENITEQSSQVLQTGLNGCDDFTNNFWNGNAAGVGNETNNSMTFVPLQSAYTLNQTLDQNADDVITLMGSSTKGASTWVYNKTALPSVIANAFTIARKPQYLCRNKTLLHAVEDLMNNITISLLSDPNFTSRSSTPVNVTYFTSVNIYQYDSRNLIISYSIALGVTFLAACLGFYSLYINGVVHSTSFSALITTTRNNKLDSISEGHSLGGLPLDKDVLKSKLRFGELNEGDGNWLGETHLGFGFAENVTGLTREGRYV